MDSRSKGFAIDTARIVEMFLNTTKKQGDLDRIPVESRATLK